MLFHRSILSLQIPANSGKHQRALCQRYLTLTSNNFNCRFRQILLVTIQTESKGSKVFETNREYSGSGLLRTKIRACLSGKEG